MLINKRIPVRYIAKKIQADVLKVLTFSVLFHILKLFFVGHLPEVPLHVPTILGTAISLMLAFNLSQSYDRWWEARKIWGAIVNDSRSLILQLKGFLRHHPDHPQRVEDSLRRIAFRQIVWCYSLGQTLRGLPPLTTEQTDLLSHEDLEFLAHQRNKPYGLLMMHMKDLQGLLLQDALSPFQHMRLDETIVRLCGSLGRAERIKNTVFPVLYLIFIHYFIYLFLITLSLALVPTMGVYEIPTLILIASTYFLIEKTARYMQDPFSNSPTDTAVTAIARQTEINIREILLEEDVPEPLAPQSFFLM